MRTLTIIGLWMGGCTYVTRAEYEVQLLERDEDADGVSVGDGDCDDGDPDAYPGHDEVPYDGIDNDCGGDGDLIDVDSDGHASVVVGGVDCRDEDASVNPSQVDTPYDGIDADCAADNDFDVDGDGVMVAGTDPSTVATYKQEWQATFTEAYDDCDDLDDAVYPDAPGEVPYDGVDTDCDGADDYDADGDGWPIPDDCLDEADPALAADPALVYPGAPDPAYDGIDADCTGDNDFDVDGDGYVRTGDEAAYDAYEAFYGFGFAAGDGDCDDDDDTIHPGQLEQLGDATDADCDGAVDGAPFAMGGLSWSVPRSPRWAATDDDLVLAVVADELDDGVNVLPNVATGLIFDGQGGPAPGVVQRVTMVGPDAGEFLDAGLAIVGDGDAFVLASVDERSAGRTFTIVQRFSGSAGTYVGETPSQVFHGGGAFAAVAAELALDGGETWLWSCGGGMLQATRASDLATATTSLPIVADTCFAEVSGTTGTLCGSTGCLSMDFDPTLPALAFAGVQPHNGQAWTRARRHAGLLVTTDGVGAWVDDGLASVQVLPTHTVLDVDGVEQAGEWFVTAVVDPGSGPELVLAWGPAGGPLQETTLSGFDAARPALEPQEVAVVATPTRLGVAVSLTEGTADDALAWTVYER